MLSGALMLAAVHVGGPAQAQGNAASAEVLFSEGRRLMSEGKAEAACPKFAASNSLDPSSGTLLNLAACYEQLGRTASAWATYQEAASRAQSADRQDHLRVAQKRAAALEPGLARVTLSVTDPAEGLQVKRDNVLVTQPEWGLAIPVDPGIHVYTATAPQRVTWKQTLQVKVEPGAPAPTLTVTVPALEAAPAEATPPAGTAADKPGGDNARDNAQPQAGAQPATSSWTGYKTGAVVAGGVGVIALGVGTVFALVAKSTYDTSLAGCPRDKDLCTPQGVQDRDDARSQGNVATAFVLIGTAAVATGVVLWLVSPTTPEGASVGLSPSPSGLTMRARF